MNTCARCEQVFSKWSEYYHHHTKASCVKVIRPKNTSGRSKLQIVQDAEQSWLKPVLIIAALFLASSAYANCGNDKGVGNGCSGNIVTIVGPEGPMGPKGENGLNGRDGIDGADGADGVDGANGKNGADGKDGKDGQTPVVDGQASRLSATVGAEVIWYEQGRVSIGSGYDYNFRDDNHNWNVARVYLRVGKSSVDRELDELRKEINYLKSLAHPPARSAK